jgi:hypothetical protein
MRSARWAGCPRRRDSGVPAGRMRVAIVADDTFAEVDASVRDDLRRHGSHMDDAEYAAAQQQAAGHPPHSREVPAWHWRGLTISRRDCVPRRGARSRFVPPPMALV